VTSVNVNTSRAQQDVTGLDSDGTERVVLRGDYAVDMSGVFDDAQLVTDAFGDLSVIRSLTVTYPAVEATMEVALTSFNASRGADGSMTWTAAASSADGVTGIWGAP